MTQDAESTHLKSKARTSLLAGALGDSIGGIVEFMRFDEIQKSFGAAGIQRPEFSEAYGRKGAVTDDTQMALFTGEGLIRAWVRGHEKGIAYPPSVVHHAYLRWLRTQGLTSQVMSETQPDGWLWSIKELHHRRAPGNTCLHALQSAQHLGEEARNDSKGCGAVMRAAPIGIFANACALGLDRAFELGIQTGKLTHGHPSGYYSSGALAVIVAALMADHSIAESVNAAISLLNQHSQAAETIDAINSAIALHASGQNHQCAIKQLGEGWVGAEALAIGIYCALSADSLAGGILMAANHDGDSDSTASITGNLLGCVFPESDLPSDWLRDLELSEVIVRMAEDLVVFEMTYDYEREQLWERYPGW